MLNDAEILKLFLPELLIEHFEMVKFEEENKILHICFEEKNTVPKEFSSAILQSKGFVPEITVDDFPLRGKTVKIHIKRSKTCHRSSSANKNKHRWEAIEMENELLERSKGKELKTEIEIFSNGDTRKQLLARSRYLLYKSKEKWTLEQSHRAEILFYQYPNLEKAYRLSDELRKIYNQNITKSVAMLKLAHWFKNVEESGFKSFTTLKRTITRHYSDILNYFEKRSTNASAESFNTKIKNFRLQLRGVRDKSFFLFRLSKLFA